MSEKEEKNPSLKANRIYIQRQGRANMHILHRIDDKIKLAVQLSTTERKMPLKGVKHFFLKCTVKVGRIIHFCFPQRVKAV